MRSRRFGPIYLYDGVGQDWFSAAAVRDHLARWLGDPPIEIRADLLRFGLDRAAATGPEPPAPACLALRLAQARILNPTKELAGSEAIDRRPLKPEIDYEVRVLTGQARATPGVIYDGIELQRIALDWLGRAERGLGRIHVWFTERLIGTWDEANRRYHARVSTYGCPSIVSTSGMVAGPARDRRYYLARRLGVAAAAADEQLAGEALVYEDLRTTEIAKGYAMQAVVFVLAGDPFCEDPQCRLFNAHWQRHMLRAQLSGPDYCERHRAMFASWRKQGLFAETPSR